MEEIIKSVENIYSKSDKIRFISDFHGKILWKHGDSITDDTQIVFCDGLGEDKSNERHEKVSIDGTLFSAYGSVISFDGKDCILWQADTVTDVLFSFGKTDTLVDTSFLIASARNDIEQILKLTREIGKNESVTGNTEIEKILNLQKKQCFDLLRSIEAVSQISSVIYNRTPKSSALCVTDELAEIIEECNNILSSPNIKLTLNCDKTDNEHLYINAGKHHFHVSLLAVFKKILGCCEMCHYTVTVTSSPKSITVSFPYKYDSEYQTTAINDDFEIYSAKLYISCIGGTLSEEIKGNKGKITLTLPVYKPTGFNSPINEYNARTTENVAEIYLYGLKGEFK